MDASVSILIESQGWILPCFLNQKPSNTYWNINWKFSTEILVNWQCHCHTMSKPMLTTFYM